MFDFIIFFVIGGVFYLMGEVISLTHCLDSEFLDYPKWLFTVGDILSVGLLALFCWLGTM